MLLFCFASVAASKVDLETKNEEKALEDRKTEEPTTNPQKEDEENKDSNDQQRKETLEVETIEAHKEDSAGESVQPDESNKEVDEEPINRNDEIGSMNEESD